MPQDRHKRINNVVKDGELRLHPIITRLVDKETLEKMGARQGIAPDA